MIDERFNSGGQIPDQFIELLDYAVACGTSGGVRDGPRLDVTAGQNFGAKAMLINGWSGSGGDCFLRTSNNQKLDPLIGQRTWGLAIWHHQRRRWWMAGMLECRRSASTINPAVDHRELRCGSGYRSGG